MSGKRRKRRVHGQKAAVTSHAFLMEEGWLPANSAMNFWQMGKNVRPYGSASAMVEACLGAYSQTVAMCPGDHWRLLDNGGRERVTNSALARILRKPNDYQSISDFLLNLTRRLYDEGNAYALAIRNDRFEIVELHLMNSRASFPWVVGGEVFYSLGGNEIAEQRFGSTYAVPARDVLHVRLQTPRDILRGESPICAAAPNIAAGNAALEQQIAFFINQARPSIILSTDQKLVPAQVKQIHDSFSERAARENVGGTPILHSGLKPYPVYMSAQDAQLAEMLKMSDQAVAEAFRIPLQVFGLGGVTYASTELLMQAWIAAGLGFALNHIEESIGRLFGLKGQPIEYLELSTKVLLRSAFKERIEGLARGVQSGIYSPDEARAEEEFAAAPGGHGAEPRVQQQVIPLSAWKEGLGIADTPAPDPAASNPVPDPVADVNQQDYSADAILERVYARSRCIR